MGNSIMATRSINFEDMQSVIQEQNNQAFDYYQKTVIINTLPAAQQGCLISGTLDIDKEVAILNTYLNKNKDIRVIVYGLNATDETCLKKCEQLMKLGFYNVYTYAGGLFEWLLLQDIYGCELFQTTAAKVDLLKFKGRRILNIGYLENN